MTANDADQTRRADDDRATLAIRRAAVRMFMATDPDAQRRALAAATDDARTIRLAMQMIGIDAHEPSGCWCRSADACGGQ